MDEDDMLKLVRAYDVADRLQKIINILTETNESFGSGCFGTLLELEDVIIKYSVPEMQKSIKGMEPLGVIILQSHMCLEAKVDYLLGERFSEEEIEE